MKKNNLFSTRHIGTNAHERELMLKSIGYTGMDEFIEAVIPSNILEKKNISIGEQRTEEEVLEELRNIATKNKVYKSFIGQGHYNLSLIHI